MNRAIHGFTLVEMLVVIIMLAVLLSLAYPSYRNYLRKGKRADATTVLLNWAERKEAWHADHIGYADDDGGSEWIPPVASGYTFSTATTPTGYTLTATAAGDQAADNQFGIACPALTLDSNGKRGPEGHEGCW